LEVSVLPQEANTVLGLFCHWQNTTDRILDLNRIWIWNCQFIGFGFWNEIFRTWIWKTYIHSSLAMVQRQCYHKLLCKKHYIRKKIH